RLERARPAKPLKPRRDLGVIQVWMIAAAGADELKYVCVAAVEASVHDADWLAPQERRAPVAGLAGQRECHDIPRPDAQPRGTTIVRTRGGAGGPPASRSGT